MRPTPTEWNQLPAAQTVRYDDPALLRRVLSDLGERLPLVHPGEVERLKRYLAAASEGQRFVLQGGDCAELFSECTVREITDKLKIILQMSLLVFYGLRRPVVRIGRIAGQYAKPRSSDTERVGGVDLPSYRGDLVNGFAPTPEARRPDPLRLLTAYDCSSRTLNWLRALNDSGFADVRHPEMWDLSHLKGREAPGFYTDLAERVREANRFLELVGGGNQEFMSRVDLFTSHEALHLDYETALTRSLPEAGGRPYNLGAHFLWVGERTRQPGGAHVAYLRAIANPVGVKLGPTADPGEAVELCRLLNPENEPGRLTLITRMGVQRVREALPRLVCAVQQAGQKVTWLCDPMHGNIRQTRKGTKTRAFEDILAELRLAEELHHGCGSRLNGVHFELTGADVTECVGGTDGPDEDGLDRNYLTYCDPRLNYFQSMEIACLIADSFGRLTGRGRAGGGL